MKKGFKSRRARLFLTRLIFGRTTEGTLGRWSSAIANCARRRVGGGVLLNFNKLAAFSISICRATIGSPVVNYGLGISKLNKIKAIDKFDAEKLRFGFHLFQIYSLCLQNKSYTICDIGK